MERTVVIPQVARAISLIATLPHLRVSSCVLVRALILLATLVAGCEVVALPNLPATPVPTKRSTTIQAVSTSTRILESPIPTLPPLKVSGWETIVPRTICLRVEESYPQNVLYSPSLNDTARDILTGMGFRVVSKEASCDGTLTFSLIGHALSEKYSYVPVAGYPGETCYSGAEVTGHMMLTIPERAPIDLVINVTYSPPKSISWCAKYPREAPFGIVGPRAALDGLTQLWGVQPLIQALGAYNSPLQLAAVEALGKTDTGPKEAVPALIKILRANDPLVRKGAAEVLGKIGPEAKDAVPALIENVGDKDADARIAAENALRAITGQKYGWQQWLENQKQIPANTPTK